MPRAYAVTTLVESRWRERWKHWPPIRLSPTHLTWLFVLSVTFTAWVPFSVNIEGLNLRVSQILLPIVLAVLWTQRPTLRATWRELLALAAAATLWGLLLFWTVLENPGVRPVARVALTGLNMLHVLAAYLLVVRLGRLRPAIEALLLSVAVLNGVLIVAAGGAAAGVPLFQPWVVETMQPAWVNGKVVDASILRLGFSGVTAGCVSAAVVVIGVSELLDRTKRVPRWYLPAVLGAGVGLVIGFSRQAVVSLAAGLLVLTLYLLWRGQIRWILKIGLLVVVVAGVALAVVWFSPGGQPYVQAFAARVLQLFQPEAYQSGTVGARAQIWGNMWADVVKNPLAGRGQDAYLAYMIYEGEEGSHNYALEVLHAAGAPALVPYLALHGMPLLWAVQGLGTRGLAASDRLRLAGLIGGYVAVLLASLTNLIFWAPIYWLVMGLLLGAVRLSAADRPQRHSTAILSQSSRN